MKKMLFLMVILVGFFIGVNSAYPLAVKFETVDYFAWGRLYTPDGVKWNPINLNPFGGSSTQSLFYNTYTAADGTEDAWGITRIARIANPSGTITYASFTPSPGATQELTVFFHAGDDVLLSAPSVFGTNLASTGWSVQMYLDNTPDYDPTLGTAGRTGVSTYTNVTDGTLVLDLVCHTQWFDYGAGNIQPFVSLETGNPATGQFIGGSTFDVVGGLWASMYDTNTITAPFALSGSNADFDFSYSTRGDPGVADWVVGDTSNAYGDVIPEPATMILLGSGLIGLAGFARRRFKK